MPAVVSSPIPPVLDQLCDQPDAAEDELPGLLARLAEVPEPRKPHGVRHSLVYVPALAACAVLADATSLLAISDLTMTEIRRYPRVTVTEVEPPHAACLVLARAGADEPHPAGPGPPAGR
nr:transposase family protein [Streptomyces hygroscopicus]